jgi:hypothetical protein
MVGMTDPEKKKKQDKKVQSQRLVQKEKENETPK